MLPGLAYPQPSKLGKRNAGVRAIEVYLNFSICEAEAHGWRTGLYIVSSRMARATSLRPCIGKPKHPGSAATSQGCKYLGNNKFPYCSVNFDLGF